MIEEELFAHLKTNVTSVDERIYPLIMPQNCTKPALVYTVIFDGDEQTINGCVVCNNIRFQVDVYSESYAEAKTIKEEVKAALYTFDAYPIDLYTMDGFEEEEELFRQIIDFRLRSE